MKQDSDVYVGIVLLIAAFFGVVETMQLPRSSAVGVSGAFYPNIIFAVIAGCGCGLIFQGLTRTRKNTMPKFNWKELIPILLVLLAYVFLLEYLGFIIMTLIFMVVCMWLLGERRPLFLAAVPLVGTFGIYYLFSNVFLISFP